MDASRFDRMSRVLAGGMSRRRALAAAFGIGAATVAGLEPASAATRCRPFRNTCTRDSHCCSGSCPRGKATTIAQRNRCACEVGSTVCGNRCTDTATDTRNCGACGNRCGGSAACVDGVCQTGTCADSEAFACLVSTDGEFELSPGQACFFDVFDEGSCAANAACQTRIDTDLAVNGELEDLLEEAPYIRGYCLRAIWVNGEVEFAPNDTPICAVLHETWCGVTPLSGHQAAERDVPPCRRAHNRRPGRPRRQAGPIDRRACHVCFQQLGRGDARECVSPWRLHCCHPHAGGIPRRRKRQPLTGW
jgi:hypothetical protein